MTTAIYIRVSTDDQTTASQRAEIERWLISHPQAGPLVWFEDSETGKTLNRPQFKKLEKLIAVGKCDTVIVWRLDRLARSFRDGVQLVSQWIEAGVRLISITQQIDLSGVVGQMIAAVLFAFAQLELETSKDRQRAGIELAKQRGVYKGRAKGMRKADPSEARRLHELGLTKNEIAALMGIGRKTVYRYLKDKT